MRPPSRASSRGPFARLPAALAALACAAVATPAFGAALPRPGGDDPAVARARRLVTALEGDAASPRALATLVELQLLEEELPDLAALSADHRRLADDPRAVPEVAAYARLRLAELERTRGDLDASRAAVERLAFLRGWWVAGPFDNDGKRGFDEAYPPEERVDLAARYRGKARVVGWRELPPEAFALGFWHAGAVLRPAREVVVYAAAAVEAPRAMRVRLHLGASGAVKLFHDGALVHADPSYHPARLDQVTVELELHPGPNRLLLKLCHAEGRLGFYARLADASDRPLALPAAGPASLAGPVGGAAAAAGAPRARTVPGAVEALARRAGEARGTAAGPARVDLALALVARRPGEDRERRAAAEARRAAELAPRSVDARLLAARLDDDRNRRRRQLEEALAAHPADPRVLTALGRDALRRGHLAEARRLLLRARAAAPGAVDARLALADLDEQLGFGERAAAARRAAAADVPRHHGAVVAAARAERTADRLAQAEALLRRALALRFDDATARTTLLQLLLDRGDLDGALALLREGVRLDPADLDARLRLGELLAANGRREDAELAFADALRLVPEEPEVLERRGQARLRAGRTGDALQDFQAALELKPQNARLKEQVRAMEPARERFERPYLHDAVALARAAPAPAPEDDAVVLADLRVTRVFPSGLSSRFTQLVVRVVNQRGADAWRTWSAPYAADRQEVRVERARVVKPDGTIVDTFQESDRSTSEPWYRLYYDTRARQLAFPGLAPGDLLEIAVRTDDVGSDNILSDYFGELVFLADRHRKLRADYVLLVPAHRTIHAGGRDAPGIERTQRDLPDGVVEHRWTARGVAAVRSEPGMPGWSEVAPYVHVSTYRSWDEVARWYWALVRDQLAPTPAVRETALRLAAEVRAGRRARGEPEAGDELALIQAVHRFVVTNTRYVGLEFGIHGYKPYRVEQVLERRFGDCKDKASLTHALLESLGIDSRLVLLRMRKLGAIADRPASLAPFNHAILHVPRYDLWLDGTAAYSGSRDLPAEDRGAAVLVVEPPGTGRFGTIPQALPGDDVTASTFDVTLAGDGAARVSGETRVRGAQAPAYRRAYATAYERGPQLEQAFSRSFPGLTVEAVEASELGRLEDEVVLRYRLAVARLADPEGRGLVLLPLGAGHRYAESLAPLSTRQFDLELGSASESRLAYRWRLPEGWAVETLPQDVRLELPFASFEATYRRDAGGLRAETRLAVRASRIARADYPAFREFLARVDRALAQPVRLHPGAGRAASAEAPR